VVDRHAGEVIRRADPECFRVRLALKAPTHKSLGNAPGLPPRSERALKARLNNVMNRAFSAQGLDLQFSWGVAPGCLLNIAPSTLKARILSGAPFHVPVGQAPALQLCFGGFYEKTSTKTAF
jgi:hypothetical protein